MKKSRFLSWCCALLLSQCVLGTAFGGGNVSQPLFTAGLNRIERLVRHVIARERNLENRAAAANAANADGIDDGEVFYDDGEQDEQEAELSEKAEELQRQAAELSQREEELQKQQEEAKRAAEESKDQLSKMEEEARIKREAELRQQKEVMEASAQQAAEDQKKQEAELSEKAEELQRQAAELSQREEELKKQQEEAKRAAEESKDQLSKMEEALQKVEKELTAIKEEEMRVVPTNVDEDAVQEGENLVRGGTPTIDEVEKEGPFVERMGTEDLTRAITLVGGGYNYDVLRAYLIQNGNQAERAMLFFVDYLELLETMDEQAAGATIINEAIRQHSTLIAEWTRMLGILVQRQQGGDSGEAAITTGPDFGEVLVGMEKNTLANLAAKRKGALIKQITIAKQSLGKLLTLMRYAAKINWDKLDDTLNNLNTFNCACEVADGLAATFQRQLDQYKTNKNK